MKQWTTKYYLYYFLIGVVSAIIVITVTPIIEPMGEFLPLKAGNGFLVSILLWLFLLSISLLLKNPKTLRIALPLSIFMFAVNYQIFSGSLFFYPILFLFSPINLFPPIFALFLLILSFKCKNEDTCFALRAISTSYIGLAIALSLLWWYIVSQTYPDYV